MLQVPTQINVRWLKEETYLLFLLYLFFFGVYVLCRQYYILKRKKELSKRQKQQLKIHHKRQHHSHGVITGPQVSLRHRVAESFQK